MLGFVIPFKAKAKSKDWAFDSWLLRRTLGSVLNQTDGGCRAYVVYTDLPDNPLQSDRVRWVQFPYAFVGKERISDWADYVQLHKLERLAEGYFDQGKRVLYGCGQAKADGCNYLMSLDADDLVSRKVSAFVESQRSGNAVGWHVNEGYEYREGKQYLLRVPRNMHAQTASANIVRADLVPEPDFLDTRLETYSFFPAHAYLRTRIWREQGVPLAPLPFPAVVYVRHSNAWSSENKEQHNRSLRRLVKWAVRYRPLSKHVRQEFNLCTHP